MMLSILRSQAQASAEDRGHVMSWSAPYRGEMNSLQNGECENCGRWAQVNTRPMPNEIDISGPAVAEECD